MPSAKRTDPDLWEKVKKEIIAGDKGGEPGQWSARKAQMAVQEYKRLGGGYTDDSPGQKETDLHEWTAEDWGTRSGEESGDTGERYLPKKVRMLLTEDEYVRSTAKKRRDTHRHGQQHSGQPADVQKKVARLKADGPTREMLQDRARELEVEGRSSMSKQELLEAIENATDSDGRKPLEGAGLEEMTKDELYEQAQKAGIEGRSSMSKEELLEALSKQG